MTNFRSILAVLTFVWALGGTRPGSHAQAPPVTLPAESPAQGRVISNFVVDRSVFTGGEFYYAILNETTRQIVARGLMDVEGIDRIILAPETPYRVLAFYAETLAFSYARFTTPPSGSTFQIPFLVFRQLINPPDADADGLSDDLEFIAGTNAQNPDTDNDGFLDGAEVTQGKNPLDGFLVKTGIIAAGPVPGPALDICAINNVALVACGTSGLAIFNVRAGTAPIRLGVVDTPGTASAVTCYNSLVAVADGAEGVAIIDAADPPAARIIHQIRFGSAVQAVAARGHYVFAGLADGTIVMVDMFSGTESGRYRGGLGPIEDLGERRGLLYALVSGSLYTLRPNDGDFEMLHRADAPGGRGAGGLRLRLFVGDNFLLATHASGVNRYSLAIPAAPSHLGNFTNGQFGWKQMVGNGGGLAVATTSPNSTPDGPHDLDFYNMGAGNTTPAFVRTFETPGLATAVSLYNGLAYVADGAAGLQVINYLAFDVGKVPPAAQLIADSLNGNLEEGKIVSVRVVATDDVQVRNVEFFIDDRAVVLDGNFPYEVGLLAPVLTDTRKTFTLHAVITDTGGNRTVTPPQAFTLVPDATPPRVRVFRPPGGAVIGRLPAAVATFSEPIRQSTLTADTVIIKEAGPDKILRTADDVFPVNLTWEYQNTTDTLAFRFDGGAAPGLYEVVLSPPLADRAGNPLAAPFVSTFRVFGFADADQDGVPDDLEAILGLDPNNPDSDNDNITDGLEDFDNDGLANVGEIVLGLDPKRRDTDGNGVNDGVEDADFDGLNNGEETRRGTNPQLADSDNDGISDATEIAENTNPLDAGSTPRQRVYSDLLSFVNGAPESFLSGVKYPVTSAPVSYLNGAPQIPPGGQQQFVILSPTVSYLNAIPAVPLVGQQQFVLLSPTVSYLNGAPEVPTAVQSRYVIASASVSYFNSALAAADLSRFVVSPVYSYRNQP